MDVVGAGKIYPRILGGGTVAPVVVAGSWRGVFPVGRGQSREWEVGIWFATPGHPPPVLYETR